jgi:K+ transporter
MAIDSWFPHRFSALSERLTTRNGIIVMGVSALAALLYTHGMVSTLVVMYSINVFLTFSLSEFGMSRFFITHRRHEKMAQHLSVHMAGLILCMTILTITVYEKFMEGGWITLLITAVVIGLCYVIRGHYDSVLTEKFKLERYLSNIPTIGKATQEPLNQNDRTAIQLVNGFNGFGVHTFYLSCALSRTCIKNFILYLSHS